MLQKIIVFGQLILSFLIKFTSHLSSFNWASFFTFLTENRKFSRLGLTYMVLQLVYMHSISFIVVCVVSSAAPVRAPTGVLWK